MDNLLTSIIRQHNNKYAPDIKEEQVFDDIVALY